MTEPQRVPDEQLTEWVSDATPDPGEEPSLADERVTALIADLRASRAREALLEGRLRAHEANGSEDDRRENPHPILVESDQDR